MTLVTTMIQGKDVVVGLRDKKNWEQHTTQQQREDTGFSTSYGDNLKAKEPSETPKVSSPVETPKVEELPSTTKPISERPSGLNYRIEAQKAMLSDKIASDGKFLDMYFKREGIDKNSDQAKKMLNDYIVPTQTKLDNVEKNDNPKLPHIPMGENTHTRSTDGYIHGATRIKMQGGLDRLFISEPAYKLINNDIMSAWNNMPDEHRNLVKTLIIKKSRAGEGRGGKAGSYDHDTGELIMVLSTSKNADSISSMYHEMGHARWYNMKDTQPERVEKFIEGMRSIGMSATTHYAESYRNHERSNTRSANNYRMKAKRRGQVVSQKSEDILEHNRIRAKTIYENESHSELNSYAMGTLPKARIIVSEATLAKQLNLYKEMYDLE